MAPPESCSPETLLPLLASFDHKLEKENMKYKRVKYKVGPTTVVIKDRYVNLKIIGKGAYGVVYSAYDRELEKEVAIKKIVKAFTHRTLAKRLLREITILKKINHENVIQLLDIQRPDNVTNFEEIYLVTDIMDTDLHNIIASNQPLTDDHIQYFLYQILCGLKYIHSAEALHRDIKPANILINSDCNIKICDLGLSVDDRDQFMTNYVVTRWYRAPELLCGFQEYSKPVDVWSVGCIMGELLLRKPLFKGKSTADQLKCIVNILGNQGFQETNYANMMRDEVRDILTSTKQTKTLKSLFPKIDGKALDLLEKILRLNPEERLSVEKALEHEYFAELHDPIDEPIADYTVNLAYEQEIQAMVDMKCYVYATTLNYHPITDVVERHKLLDQIPINLLPKLQKYCPSNTLNLYCNARTSHEQPAIYRLNVKQPQRRPKENEEEEEEDEEEENKNSSSTRTSTDSCSTAPSSNDTSQKSNPHLTTECNSMIEGLCKTKTSPVVDPMESPLH